MRPIKFRAWDSKKKKMRFLENADFEITYSGLYVHGEFDTYTKVDWPLEQFTGLLDKNGREIYEGDVVRALMYSDKDVLDSSIEVVAFSRGAFQDANGEFDIDHYHEVEIIGNIHEQGSLLSGK